MLVQGEPITHGGESCSLHSCAPFRASPFCPHCLTLLLSAWTHHVLWSHRRPWLAHGGPFFTNHLYHYGSSRLSRGRCGTQTQRHQNYFSDLQGDYKKLQSASMLLSLTWRVTCLCREKNWYSASQYQTSSIYRKKLTAGIFVAQPCCNISSWFALVAQGARSKKAWVETFGHIHTKPHEARLNKLFRFI